MDQKDGQQSAGDKERGHDDIPAGGKTPPAQLNKALFNSASRFADAAMRLANVCAKAANGAYCFDALSPKNMMPINIDVGAAKANGDSGRVSTAFDCARQFQAASGCKSYLSDTNISNTSIYAHVPKVCRKYPVANITQYCSDPCALSADSKLYLANIGCCYGTAMFSGAALKSSGVANFAFAMVARAAKACGISLVQTPCGSAISIGSAAVKLTLGNVSVASFDDDTQLKFQNAIAAAVGLSNDSVIITGYANTAARRGDALSVDTTVVVPPGSTVDQTAVTSALTDSTSLSAYLAAAGVAGGVTGAAAVTTGASTTDTTSPGSQITTSVSMAAVSLICALSL